MIFVKNKGLVLCRKKKILKNIFQKAFGLMFSKPIKDEGYVFYFNKPRKVTIHMFFVFFSIDILFLDENKKIIEIKENLKPFSIYTSKNKIKYFIELPQGSLMKVSLYDEIVF